MRKHKLTGQGGKGSAPRGTDHKKYTDNWDKIFGPKIKPEQWDKQKDGNKNTKK